MKNLHSYISKEFANNLFQTLALMNPFDVSDRLDTFRNLLLFINDQNNYLYISEEDAWVNQRSYSNDFIFEAIVKIVFGRICDGGGEYIKKKQMFSNVIEDKLSTYSFGESFENTCNIYSAKEWSDYININQYFITKNSRVKSISSWKEIEEFNHLFNSIIICDDYLLDSSKGYVEEISKSNIKQLLSCLLDKQKGTTERIDITIISYLKDSNLELEYWYDYIEDILINELDIINSNLSLINDVDKEVHDRRIITNYHVINSSNSFRNYFNKDDKIGIKGIGGELFVYPYTARVKDGDLIKKLFFESVIFSLTDFINKTELYKGSKTNRLINIEDYID